MSFVMHETVYFGRSLPFVIMDRIPYFHKYKIQGVSFCDTQSENPANLHASTKYLLQPNSGNAPNSSSSPTSQSNFLKSGSSTQLLTFSACPQASLFHPGKPWLTKLPSFSFLKMPGITGFTEPSTLLYCTRRFTSYTTSIALHLVWQPSMLLRLRS